MLIKLNRLALPSLWLIRDSRRVGGDLQEVRARNARRTGNEKSERREERVCCRAKNCGKPRGKISPVLVPRYAGYYSVRSSTQADRRAPFVIILIGTEHLTRNDGVMHLIRPGSNARRSQIQYFAR